LNEEIKMEKDVLLKALYESNYASELLWQQEGICRQTDPDAFFPESIKESRAVTPICGNCSVIKDCLIFAIENDEEYGIWGGIDFTSRESSRTTTVRAHNRPEEVKELANRLRSKTADFATIYAEIRKRLTTKGRSKSNFRPLHLSPRSSTDII